MQKKKFLTTTPERHLLQRKLETLFRKVGDGNVDVFRRPNETDQLLGDEDHQPLQKYLHGRPQVESPHDALPGANPIKRILFMVTSHSEQTSREY